MATFEEQRLPAPNALHITEDDRARLYETIGNELNDILSGSQAYFPDGSQKDPQDIANNLMSFVGSLKNLRDHGVIDPSNVLGPMVDALEKHSNDLAELIENQQRDPIELPNDKSLDTRDNRFIQVHPFPGPFTPPNPLSPKNWPKFLNVSSQIPNGAPANSGSSAVVGYPTAPAQITAPLGVYVESP